MLLDLVITLKNMEIFASIIKSIFTKYCYLFSASIQLATKLHVNAMNMTMKQSVIYFS